jgi:hypothetical protein
MKVATTENERNSQIFVGRHYSKIIVAEDKTRKSGNKEGTKLV